MIDMLDWIVLPDQSKGCTYGPNKLPYSRQTHGYEGSTFDVVAMDAKGNPNKWTRIKTAQGWPWDIKLIGATIYDWITEQSWVTDPAANPPTYGPRDYKKFVSNHMPEGPGQTGDGVAMFPRFVAALANGIAIDTPAAQSGFRIYKNCVWDGAQHNIGDIRQVITGPFLIDHGGDIGMQPTLVHRYFWGGKVQANGDTVFGTMEQNLYVLNFGWTQWIESKIDAATGLYFPTLNQSGYPNVTRHNKLVACKVPTVNFPCF